VDRNISQSYFRAWARCPLKPCREGPLGMRKPSTCRSIKCIHSSEDDATWTTFWTIINSHMAASKQLAAKAGFLLSSCEDKTHQERQIGSRGSTRRENRRESKGLLNSSTESPCSTRFSI